MRGKTIIILTALAFAAGSCMQETIPSGVDRRIRASVCYDGLAKGVVLTEVPDVFHLFAASYTGSVPGKTNYIYGETMTKYSGEWISDNVYGTIPPNRNVLYWAVAGSAGVTLPAASAAGWPKISYVSPATASAQEDIIVAVSSQVGSKESLTLPFSHILCAVEAKVSAAGAFDGTITAVTLKNVYGQGDYIFGEGWGNVGMKTDLVSALSVVVTEGDGGKVILSGSSTLLMIPQTLPDDAAVEVTATVDGRSVSVSAPLTGVEVVAGHKAVLNLDLSGFRRKQFL